MGRRTGFLTVTAAALVVVALSACGGDDGGEQSDPRQDAVRACMKSDETLDRTSCSCLVDELALTADEIAELDKLESAAVADANAELERILGPRRAAILLTTTADCNSM